MGMRLFLVLWMFMLCSFYLELHSVIGINVENMSMKKKLSRMQENDANMPMEEDLSRMKENDAKTYFVKPNSYVRDPESAYGSGYGGGYGGGRGGGGGFGSGGGGGGGCSSCGGPDGPGGFGGGSGSGMGNGGRGYGGGGGGGGGGGYGPRYRGFGLRKDFNRPESVRDSITSKKIIREHQ